MSDWTANPLAQTRIAVADWLRDRCVGADLPVVAVTRHELLDLGVADRKSPHVVVTGYRPNPRRLVTGQGTGIAPQFAIHTIAKRRPDDGSDVDRLAADADLENIYDAAVWVVMDALAATKNPPHWKGIEFLPNHPPTRTVETNGNTYRFGTLLIECQR